MKARLRPQGYALLLIGLTLCALGAVSQQTLAILWGALPLGWLVVAWWRIAILQGYLQAGGVRLRVTDPALVQRGQKTGQKFQVQFRAEGLPNLTATIAVTPVMSSAFAVGQPSLPDDQGILSLELCATSAGHWVVHGLWLHLAEPSHLYVLPHYLPVSLELPIAPALPAEHRRTMQVRMRTTVTEGIQGRRRPQRGFGMEIRELRDHVPGDPFKRIAWKASARHGRLIVREFESEQNLSVYFVIDVSSSMRTGPSGATPLDRTIALAHAWIHHLARQRQRFGLVTFDRRVSHFCSAGTGHRTLLHVLNRLNEIPHVIDEDQTLITDGELFTRVGNYLEQQEGMPVRRLRGSIQGLRAEYDPDAVLAFVEESLARKHRHDEHLLPANPQASSPETGQLRLFCRLHGIELPYRTGRAPGDKANGLTRAIEQIAATGRGPHSIVVWSDLQDVIQPTAIIRAMALARARRHRMLVLCPSGHSQTVQAETRFAEKLNNLEKEYLVRAIAPLIRQLQGAGVHIVKWDLDEPLAMLLRKLSRQ